MSLIPEKRLDKTGKLVTRHVRADTAPKATDKQLPAPTAAPLRGSRGPKAGKPKLSPKMLSQARHKESISQYTLSPPLRTEGRYFLSSHVVFSASDLELYAVASVAYDTDAVLMLSKGVRTTEDAIAFLREHDMEPVFDRTAITQEAISRNVPYSLYRDFMRNSNISNLKMDSPYLVDAMVLYGKATIQPQYYKVFHDILDGTIKAEDINTLGLTNLKPYRRLETSVEALREVNKPDAKFTISDVKDILLACNKTATGRTESEYSIALSYLIHEGPDFTRNVPYGKLLEADQWHRLSPDRFPITRFHVEFMMKHGSYFCPPMDISKIYRSGADADRVAELIAGGLKTDNAISAVQEDISPSLGTGWL